MPPYSSMTHLWSLLSTECHAAEPSQLELAARNGVGVYAPSGCRQRNPWKRAKSLSVVMSSQPCSIASAAT